MTRAQSGTNKDMIRMPNQRIYIDSTAENRRKRLRHALSGFLLGLLLPAIAGGATLDRHLSAVQRLDRFIEEVKTLTVSFKQTQLDEKGRIVEDFTGVAYLERPRLFRWEYEDPYRQTIVADGKRVWFHDHELDQVIVKPWDSFALETPAAILTTVRPLTELFDVRDMDDKGGQSAWQWVGLTPKSADATFVEAEVGFGGKGLEVMKFVDSFGQTTYFVFSKVDLNHELDPAIFFFTPPEGVDVVGADGGDHGDR